MSEAARVLLAGYARALAAWWRSRDQLLQDGILAAALASVSFTPALAANGVALGELAQHRLDGAGMALAVAQALPLVVRRRWPTLCLAAVAVAFGLFQLAGYVSTFASVHPFSSVSVKYEQ